MSLHTFCSPELVEWATTDLMAKFKGRILPPEDSIILEQVLRVARERNEKVVVFDVSRITDKVKAMKRGIKKTPTIIIDGKKYENVEEIQKALSFNFLQKRKTKEEGLLKANASTSSSYNVEIY